MHRGHLATLAVRLGWNEWGYVPGPAPVIENLARPAALSGSRERHRRKARLARLNSDFSRRQRTT